MGFVDRKKSGNIFAGSRLVVDGQGIYNVKIIKFNPERQKSPLEYFRPIVFPGPVPAPLCDFNGIIFMTPTPTPTNTVTPTPTNTVTPTVTTTPTNTPTVTTTPTNTPTVTTTVTTTPTITLTNTPTITPTTTITPTNTSTLTPTMTPTPSCNCTYIDVTISELDLALATGNTDPNEDNAVFVKYRDCSSGILTSKKYTVAETYINDICGSSTTGPETSYYAFDSQEFGESTADNNGQCCTPPTPTPTSTPTETITPTPTPTCARPSGLINGSLLYCIEITSPTCVNFTGSLSSVCDALSQISQPGIAYGGFGASYASLTVGETVYYGGGTSCITYPTGYYITNLLSPTIVHIINGIIVDFPTCPTPTPTPTITETPTNTPTPTVTPTITETTNNTPTPTNTITPTPTNTSTVTPTNTPTTTVTQTPTNTPTMTVTQTPTNTPTQTITQTPTVTPTNTITQTPTNTPTMTVTQTPTNTPTTTVTQTPTNTPTTTVTQTPTVTPTNTITQTPTNTPTNTSTVTPTMTVTQTPTNTPTNTITQTPTNTPTPTPTLTCVCYTVTYTGPPPFPEPVVGITYFSYVNCSGVTVNSSVGDGESAPISRDVCAQQNSIVITGGGDELATWEPSLENCCITNPDCFYYDVTISSIDLAASTGNTFNPDNTVFVNYTDCNGSPVSTPYTIAGTSFNDICADDTQLITVTYYQDDLSYLTISSFVTQQGNCP